MQLEVPNTYLALAPIIVTAPTTRCGTTLVQRLLTSSSNAFIYGEEIGAYIASLTQVIVNFLQLCEKLGPTTMDAEYAEALDGSLNHWRPALMPPAAVIERAWVETYYQIPLALARHGESVGRPIFGFKRPELTRDMLRAMLMMMPRARVIYLFRDLGDALRSAKSRRFVTTDADVAAFCTRWATNIRETADLAADPRVMFLRYERLADKDADAIQALEAFSGAAGLKSELLDVRVNTFASEQAGHSPDQYIEPSPLTPADLETIDRCAGSLMDELYPPCVSLPAPVPPLSPAKAGA